MGRGGSEEVKIELGRSSVGWGGRLLPLAGAGLMVAAVMGLLLLTRDRAEAFVANATVLLPVGYAFGAGMVSSVNPCGFFMLPSYLSYYLGTEEQGRSGAPGVFLAFNAVGLALVATAGFVLVFAAVGSVIALGGRPLVAYFPYGGLLIGVAMAALGLWLLVRHQSFGIAAASRVMVTPRRNLLNGFLFGLAYAIGSLSCTLPIFLVVVGSALVTRGFGASLGQFVAYSLGMGTVLVAAIIGTALFRGAVTRALGRLVPHVHTASALFLIAAGLYLVYYWVVVGGLFS